ncbi:polysaccharide deacetylase family protein [Candidatus Curtissbacteria bacterium]|nr:polysaccharide deacetylase family protein [Candidatus Curtissbacteria bacterium]
MATKERFVGVSFDDGPNSQNIQEILAILRENNCQATWIINCVR